MSHMNLSIINPFYNIVDVTNIKQVYMIILNDLQ
jgi:hypothetical protein